MAQNGISINVLADVRDAVRGADNVADAMEQVADVLKDIADEGDTSTDRMEQDFRDLTRTADREADQLRDKFRQAYRDVKRSSDDTRDTATTNVRKMGDQAGEVGQEIRQNLGEGIANAARGDFESLADTIGDTLGGAVAGIGGIGTAALGAAGALGLGAIVAVIGDIQRAQEELQELTKDWAGTYLEEGSKVLSTSTIIAKGQQILAENYEEVAKNAKLWGVSEETALSVMSGSPSAIAEVTDALKDKKKAAEEDAAAARKVAEDNGSALLSITPQEKAYQDAESALRKHTKAQQDGAKSVDLMTRFLLDEIDAAKNATVQTDRLGNKVVTLPGGKQIFIDAKTGEASENLNGFRGDLNKIPKEKAVRVNGTVDLSDVTRGIRNYRPPRIVIPGTLALGTGGSYNSRRQML